MLRKWLHILCICLYDVYRHAIPDRPLWGRFYITQHTSSQHTHLCPLHKSTCSDLNILEYIYNGIVSKIYFASIKNWNMQYANFRRHVGHVTELDYITGQNVKTKHDIIIWGLWIYVIICRKRTCRIIRVAW